MDAQVFRLAKPADFVHKFLSSGIRPDGRDALDFLRPSTLRASVLPDCPGSAALRLGNTSVVAGIVLNTTLPRAESKGLGFFQVTLQSAKLNRRESSAMAQRVEDLIRPSVTVEDLAIHVGKAVWHIHVSLVTLEEDGSLMDACVLAAVASLKGSMLPSLDADLLAGGDVYPERMLSLKTHPVTVTFHRVGDHWLPDCTREEELLSEARITFIEYTSSVSIASSEGDFNTQHLATVLIPLARKLISDRRSLLAYSCFF